MLLNISKVLEKLVYDKLYNYLSYNNMLYPKNSISQLVAISDKLYRVLDDRLEDDLVFLDASKAFDKVWHKGLSFELEQTGLSGKIIKWLNSYQNNRNHIGGP